MADVIVYLLLCTAGLGLGYAWSAHLRRLRTREPVRRPPPMAWVAEARLIDEQRRAKRLAERARRHGKLNGTSDGPPWSSHVCSADIAVMDEQEILHGYCCGVCGSMVVGADDEEEGEFV